MPAAANFDRLARIYRALEFLAFGGALERARFCFLDRLGGCDDILVLGEGDGRCLERLVGLAPHARIRCVDSSPAMLAVAAARVARPRSGPGDIRMGRRLFRPDFAPPANTTRS